MRTRTAKALHLSRNDAQNLRTLLHIKTFAAEIIKFLVRGRDGGSIDYESLRLILEAFGNVLLPVFIMNSGAFFTQLLRKRRFHTVITTYVIALRKKVTHQGAHTDASGTKEINILHVRIVESLMFWGEENACSIVLKDTIVSVNLSFPPCHLRANRPYSPSANAKTSRAMSIAALGFARVRMLSLSSFS